MRPFENRRGAPAERSSVSFAGIAALWMLGVIYLFRASWFSSLGNVSRPLGWMALGALSLLVLVPRERMGISKRAFGVMLFIGTAGLLFANIRSGSKAFIMFSFLPVIWMLLVRADLRRWRMPIGIGLLLFYFGVVAPVVGRSREVHVQKKERPLSLILSLRSGPRRESAPVCLNCTRTN